MEESPSKDKQIIQLLEATLGLFPLSHYLCRISFSAIINCSDTDTILDRLDLWS
jgi:hypothetical protein